jgi:hypothetical protein
LLMTVSLSQLLEDSFQIASAAAHVDAEFVGNRPQPALEGANDAGGDAGRVPVHAHDGAERLEPERMSEPLQESSRP